MKPVRIGARGHDVGCLPPVTLSGKFHDLGLQSIQLVPYKALPGIGDGCGEINDALLNSLHREFAANNIRVAMLGSYFNLLDNDTFEQRKQRFVEYYGHAVKLNCPMVGTETGSYNSDWSYHPENHTEKAFGFVLETIAELSEHAQQHNCHIGIEPVWAHTVFSPRKARQMLDTINSRYLKIIFDPVNLIDPAHPENTKQIIKQSVDLLGEHIALLHIKDFVINNGSKKNTSPGTGLLDFDYLFAAISGLPLHPDIIIEDMTGPDLADSISFLKRKLGR